MRLRWGYCARNDRRGNGGLGGFDPASLSVRASFPVQCRPPDIELSDLAQAQGDDRYRIQLGAALQTLEDGWLRVRIADRQGNATRIDRACRVDGVGLDLFREGFE